MKNPILSTWADGFGRWYAVVDNGEHHSVTEARAKTAIHAELLARETKTDGSKSPRPRVEFVEYVGSTQSKWREA